MCDGNMAATTDSPLNFRSSVLHYHGQQTMLVWSVLFLPYISSNYNTAGVSQESPILDPCLSQNMMDMVEYQGTIKHFKGTGDFKACQAAVQPLLNLTVPCQNPPCSFNGVFQPQIDFGNSEFYGFSEYWYCMEDILRMGGTYDHDAFQKAAKVSWSKV